MKETIPIAAAILLLAVSAQVSAHEFNSTMKQAIAHGRKLVVIGVCNDCHTPNRTAHGGHVPKAVLLTGDGLIWHGP